MTRLHRPSAGADPAMDLTRHQLGQAGAVTPRELRRVIEEELRSSPSTPRVRPVVSGSRSDGSALASLLAVLERLGLLNDRTEY